MKTNEVIDIVVTEIEKTVSNGRGPNPIGPVNDLPMGSRQVARFS